MEYYTKINDLFSYIENDEEHKAKQILEDVRKEMLDLKSRINTSDENIVKDIGSLVENVSKGQINIARGKYSRTRVAFCSLLSQNVQVKPGTNLLEGNYTDQSRKTQISQNMPHEQYKIGHENRDDNTNTSMNPQAAAQHNYGNNAPRREDPGTSSVEKRFKEQANEDSYYSKMEQSKRASRAMIQNNPDIADLSDVNRPTKIAERFSELYDNEWTEAFEALCKIQKGKLREPQIIAILLEIVEEAYRFCLHAAEQQICDMESKRLKKLNGGERLGPEYKAEDRNDLIQYRKEIAAEALEFLQQNFRKKLHEICNARLLSLPTDGKQTAKYAEKALELSWWMCVQDPPVHMCQTKIESFNPNLFRAYTKSGSELDFFVWPALKLHKDGAVLLKGVVQFK